LLLILFPANHVLAGFSIPDDVYGMSELDDAIENAREDDWILAFVLSDQNTTCGLASRATEATFQELNEDCIIVYIHMPNTNWEDLPEIVAKGLNTKGSGKYIPKTVLVNAEMNHIIDVVPYRRSDQEHRKLLKDAVKKAAIEPTFFEEIKYMLMSLIE
jgi:hypothetical protein